MRWSGYLSVSAIALPLVIAAHSALQTDRGAPITPVFPGQEWPIVSPEEAGFDPEEWNAWLRAQKPRGSGKFGEDHDGNQWGVVLTRGGYLVGSWGNPDYRYQSASVGKLFTKLALQLALDAGLIDSDRDLVMQYWTGEGELSHPHKYLNRGFHLKLTFRHLWQHTGGFPVTNGYSWKQEKDVPHWARWSGDPMYDNYAHTAPGFFKSYSSGGYWRLSQALTAIWGENLKDVLDKKLFSKIGIPADRWDWLSGRYVHDTIGFYPDMPGYGKFVDPPYSIDGNIVVGGGGWVVMSAKDLARVGLLIATGGIWCGERLISDTRLLDGHLGGNNSALVVRRGDELLVWAQVTAVGIRVPERLSVGPLNAKPIDQGSACTHSAARLD